MNDMRVLERFEDLPRRNTHGGVETLYSEGSCQCMKLATAVGSSDMSLIRTSFSSTV